MNKLVKLPLFLGICGGACAGVLAGVNAITSPIIENAKLEKANAAYMEMYKEFNVAAADITTQEVEDIQGCSVKAFVDNANVKGIAYTCQVKGYGGTVSFQIAFANGKYLGYTDLGNSETDGYGKAVIAKIGETIGQVDANTSLDNVDAYSALITGKSITGKALKSQIELCRADYLTWYSEKKGG